MMADNNTKKFVNIFLISSSFYVALVLTSNHKSTNGLKLTIGSSENATCEEGFYRWFDEEDKHMRCKSCDCDFRGTRSCDNGTGKCICHNHVMGVKCDKCANFSYGLNKFEKGCRPCNCYGSGSKSRDCDQDTGQCACNEGFRQQTCGECDISHYRLVGSSSLVCAPCNCHLNMSTALAIKSDNRATLNLKCANKTGNLEDYCLMNTELKRHCDLVTGKCSCLDQSTGRACDKCAPRHVPSPGGGYICEACNSCSSSLMDLLDDVGRDFSYANSTIDKSRLSATMGLRLSELESALGEHSAGLRSSEVMFFNSLASIGQHASKTTLGSNNTGDNLRHLIDQLEANCSVIELEARRLSSSSKSDSEHLKLLMKDLSHVDKNSHTQLNFMMSIYNELIQIEHNYQEDTVFQNVTKQQVDKKVYDLNTIDNSYVRRLIKESEEILRVQSMNGSREAISELSIQVQHLDEVIDHTRNLCDLDVGKFIALNVFNTTHYRLDNSTSTIENKLNTLNSDLRKNLVDSREINRQLFDYRQTVEINVKNLSIEFDLIQNLSSMLRESERRLNLTTDRFSIESEFMETLLEQVDDLHSLNMSMSLLKNLTLKLAIKTSEMSFDNSISQFKSKEKELSKHFDWLMDQFKSKTAGAHDWRSSLDFTCVINDILDNLNMIDESTRETNEIMASRIFPLFSAEYPIQNQSYPRVILDETKLTRSNALGELNLRLTTMRTMLSSMSSEIDSGALSLDQITEGISELNNTAGQQFDMIFDLDHLVQETNNISTVISARTSRVMELAEVFTSKWNELSQGTVNNFDLKPKAFKYSLSYGRGNFPKFFMKSNTPWVDENELIPSLPQGLMLMARRQFERLRSIVCDKINYQKIANLSQLASVDMRQSINELQKKIDDARLMVNRVSLGRKFGQQQQVNITGEGGRGNNSSSSFNGYQHHKHTTQTLQANKYIKFKLSLSLPAARRPPRAST